MPPRDSKEGREERARALRERVTKIVRGKVPETGEEKVEDSPPAKESPRDFVHRRMRELREGDKKRKK